MQNLKSAQSGPKALKLPQIRNHLKKPSKCALCAHTLHTFSSQKRVPKIIFENAYESNTCTKYSVLGPQL